MPASPHSTTASSISWSACPGTSGGSCRGRSRRSRRSKLDQQEAGPAARAVWWPCGGGLVVVLALYCWPCGGDGVVVLALWWCLLALWCCCRVGSLLCRCCWPCMWCWPFCAVAAELFVALAASVGFVASVLFVLLAPLSQFKTNAQQRYAYTQYVHECYRCYVAQGCAHIHGSLVEKSSY
jgi:hypothetical protein